MILTVEELRKFVTTDETDEVLSMWLEAIEQKILGHTHNSFRRYKNAEGVIEYPADIKMGVIELKKWELGMQGKEGIASESLSRHSVSYFNTDGNSVMGYPCSKMDFLKPYMCARFGKGLRA